jgi:predicted RND superfamily exporter protein
MRGKTLLNIPGMLAFRYPRLARLAAVFLTFIAVIAASTIRFDNDVIRAITSESERSRNYLEFSREVEQQSSDIVVLAEAKDGLTAEGLKALRDLALDMEFADGVVTVMSPFSARFGRPHPDYPGETVIPLEPDPVLVKQRLAAYRVDPHSINPLISDDLDAALLIVVADNNAIPESQILAGVTEIVGNADIPGVELVSTGRAAISVEIAERMKRDLLILNLAGDLLGVLFAVAVFRRPFAIICAAGPALFGALAALSIFALTGFPITVISNVIPMLAYVLALADGTHLVAHYTSLDRNIPKRARLLETVQTIGPACGLTAVTTAIAFGAIATTDNEPLREFAIVGGLGIMASYCAVMLWFVTLAGLLDPAGSQNKGGLPIPGLPASLKRLVLERPRGIVAAGAVLMAISAAGYATTTPWFSIYVNLPEDSVIRDAAETAEDRFGGYFRMWAEFPAPGRDTPEGWRAMAERITPLVDIAPPGNTISPLSISGWLGDENRPPTVGDLEEVANPVVEAILPQGHDIARVLILTGDPMRTEASLAMHDEIEAAAVEAGATRITGIPDLMRHEPIDLARQLSIGLVVACLVSVGLIALVFGNWHLGPVLLFPNLLPLAVTASALHIFWNGHLSPTALLALTISFGIAVDDSIHLVNRYFLELGNGFQPAEAMERAIDEVGKAMIATSVLICGGVLVTFTSAFSTIRLFGTMLIIAFAVALIADLLLLPALMRMRNIK